MDWEKLLREFFESDSLDGLLKDAGAMLGCPMLVVDDAYHIVASYVPETFRDAVFQAAIERGEITYEAISALNWDLLPDPSAGVFQPVEDSPYVRRFSCLSSAGVRIGYLICVDADGTLALKSPEDFKRLEGILAKQLICRRQSGWTSATTAEEVLAHLLDGKFSGAGAFRAQAGSTSLFKYRPDRLALINLGLYHSSNFGDDILKSELSAAFPGCSPFLYRGEVLLLLNASHDTAALDDLSGRYSLRSVISGRFTDLYLLPQVYAPAREVMDYLLGRAAGAFCAHTSQFRCLMALRRLSDRPDLIDPRISALGRYDAEHGTELCLTLYTYLACHHSVQLTCERLFTHRNTVLYRLRRLREDFGFGLDRPEEVLPLLLSSALVLLAAHRDGLFAPIPGGK